MSLTEIMRAASSVPSVAWASRPCTVVLRRRHLQLKEGCEYADTWAGRPCHRRRVGGVIVILAALAASCGSAFAQSTQPAHHSYKLRIALVGDSTVTATSGWG